MDSRIDSTKQGSKNKGHHRICGGNQKSHVPLFSRTFACAHSTPLGVLSQILPPWVNRIKPVPSHSNGMTTSSSMSSKSCTENGIVWTKVATCIMHDGNRNILETIKASYYLFTRFGLNRDKPMLFNLCSFMCPHKPSPHHISKINLSIGIFKRVCSDQKR